MSDTIQSLLPELALAFFVGVLLAAVICQVWARFVTRSAFERGLTHEAEGRSYERQLQQQRLEHAQLEQQRLEAALNSTRQALAEAEARATEARTEVHAAERAGAELKVRIEEMQRAFAEKESVYKESKAALKQEFELLAKQIFEAQGASFAQQSQDQLTSMLTPFREQMSDFKRKVEEVYVTEAKERASLLTEVKSLQASSERINAEAENLARALKGDNKLQGNWGELVLERVLEESGLRLNHEYFLQESRRTQGGDLKRPDVLIRLPDDKDVVIDAKMSLLAYEQALSAEDEQSRAGHLKQHVASVRGHVQRLAKQDYANLDGVRSLDFVLMFVPVEAAFTLAMEGDERLFTEAFEKRIVIVSPTTLMMTLRIIHNVWRYEKQNRNALEIAERAGALYDKLRLVIDDMITLGRQLDTASRTYKGAYAKLASGRGNLVGQVEKFRELGTRVKKPIAKAALEASKAADESADVTVTGVSLPGPETDDADPSTADRDDREAG